MGAVEAHGERSSLRLKHESEFEHHAGNANYVRLSIAFIRCVTLHTFFFHNRVIKSHWLSIIGLGMNRSPSLRRFEKVFRCYNVCETMKDAKEGYFIV